MINSFVKLQVSLQKLNTFGLNISTKYFAQINTLQNLIEIINNPIFVNTKKLILGGGSNLLFTSNFDGLVLYNQLKGISVIQNNDNYVLIKCGSGEIWHQVVLFALNNNWAGIENLSLIPGTAGAAPIQNIGAYGTDLSETFESLEAIDLHTGNLHTFSKRNCEFDYRNSIFKKNAKNQFFITSITLKLSKIANINTSYGDIKQTLQQMGITQTPTIQQVSEAVCSIRRSKLPNPEIIGNCGSFFKNPTILEAQFISLQQQFANMPYYLQPNNTVKIPAGWLIEQCGFKGKKVGNVGCHQQQALVIVNYGNATGTQIYNFAQQVQQAVLNKFEINLQPEVNII